MNCILVICLDYCSRKNRAKNLFSIYGISNLGAHPDTQRCDLELSSRSQQSFYAALRLRCAALCSAKFICCAMGGATADDF